jgi:transcriptional regulator with XRE-family HTH domain
MLDLHQIGKTLKQQRREKRVSQSALSARSGVSRTRIEALENNRINDISYKNVVRLLNALDLDLRLTALNAQRPTLEDLMAEDAQ